MKIEILLKVAVKKCIFIIEYMNSKEKKYKYTKQESQKIPFWMRCLTIAGKFKTLEKWAIAGFFDSDKQSYIASFIVSYFDHL